MAIFTASSKVSLSPEALPATVIMAARKKRRKMKKMSLGLFLPFGTLLVCILPPDICLNLFASV